MYHDALKNFGLCVIQANHTIYEYIRKSKREHKQSAECGVAAAEKGRLKNVQLP